MSEEIHYGVKCLEVAPSVFTSEKACRFRAYKEGNLVNAYVYADKKLVNEGVLEAQIILEDENMVLVRVQNAEDFDNFYVPRSDIVKKTKSVS